VAHEKAKTVDGQLDRITSYDELKGFYQTLTDKTLQGHTKPYTREHIERIKRMKAEFEKKEGR